MQTISQMTDMSRQREKEVEKSQGDWLSQIDQLNMIVKEVKSWQSEIFKKFGLPSTRHVSTGNSPLRFEASGSPDIFGLSFFNRLELYRGRRVSDVVDPRMNGFVLDYLDYDASFRGATILQGLQVKYLETETQVEYKATLKTDERYFLSEMLPEVTVEQKDPDYTLYNFTIKIPNGELVKESLHKLDEIFTKKEPRKSVAQRIKSKVELKHPMIFAFGAALVMLAIFSLQLLSK